MLQLIKFILTRSVIFYLACSILIWKITDHDQLLDNAVNQTMSRLTPPMDYFAEFVDKRDHYDRFKLMNCINYHKAVAHYFPFQGAEAYGMLGFCYERLGEEKRSIDSYQHAIELDPDYFWPYYDLGVIYYTKTQYTKAADHLAKGLQEDPLKTIVLTSRSKVYNDVNLSRLKGPKNYIQNLKDGRTEAYILLMDSLSKSGSYDQLLRTSMQGIKEDLDKPGIFYYYAGIALFYQKSYPKAIELLQISLQNEPDNPDALMYIGLCLKMAGQADMAQLFISKAAQLHQQGPSVLDQYLKPRVRFF